MVQEGLKDILRRLPKVDKLFEGSRVNDLTKKVDRHVILKLIQSIISSKREELKRAYKAGKAYKGALTPDSFIDELVSRVELLQSGQPLRVVNASGTILHTNLGRAPINREILRKASAVSANYCNLELDLDTGKRGERYDHFQDIITLITGAEAAIAVNNNAAAVLLVLNTFCEGKEAIVSRGELIEIGGAFRIPEVMDKSRAILKEVGTTNKTNFDDYKRAVTKNTGLLLKVHTSNYKIVGFTEEVTLPELVALGRKSRVPVFNDLGSGSLVDLSDYGIEKDDTVQDAISAGADIVSFSGDKLLGGPQAGVIVGKKRYINRIKKNPLTRALRLDKMTVSMLSETFKGYLNRRKVLRTTPVLKMMTLKKSTLEKRCAALFKELTDLKKKNLNICMAEDFSCIGGGAMPLATLETYVVTLSSKKLTCNSIAKKLREAKVPIIVRVQNNRVIIDIRTVMPGEDKDIVSAVNEII